MSLGHFEREGRFRFRHIIRGMSISGRGQVGLLVPEDKASKGFIPACTVQLP